MFLDLQTPQKPIKTLRFWPIFGEEIARVAFFLRKTIRSVVVQLVGAAHEDVRTLQGNAWLQEQRSDRDPRKGRRVGLAGRFSHTFLRAKSGWFGFLGFS